MVETPEARPVRKKRKGAKDSTETSPRRAALQVGLLCLVAFLCLLPLLKYPQPRCDDIYYLIGARGLASGQGYADISRPDSPPLTKYPPLASLLLTPFLGVIGEEIHFARLPSMVLMVLSAPLFYLWLRGRMSHFGSLAITALFLFNPMTFHLVTLQGNAGLTTLLVAAVLLMADRGLERFRGFGGWFLFGTLLVASFYAHRSLSALFVSQTVYLLFVRKWGRPALMTLLGVIVGVFPWLWRSYRLTGNWISREYEGEFVGRIQDDTLAPGQNFILQTLGHMAQNIPLLPTEIGHGLFPWSRGPGGITWGFLTGTGLGWLADSSLCLVFAFVCVGWWSEFRARRGAVECHLPFHVVMLLVFFVQFAYFAYLVPYLYYYLWRGFRGTVAWWGERAGKPDPLGREARGWAILGLVLLLLPAVGKDVVVFWGRLGKQTFTREPRWSWVEKTTPPGATVYWENLDNYSWSCWRWFDSRRTALGLTEAEAIKAADDPGSSVLYVAAPREGTLSRALQSRGWKPVYQEPENAAPTEAQRAYLMPRLEVAQQAYLLSLPPPLTLWQRP